MSSVESMNTYNDYSALIAKLRNTLNEDITAIRLDLTGTMSHYIDSSAENLSIINKQIENLKIVNDVSFLYDYKDEYYQYIHDMTVNFVTANPSIKRLQQICDSLLNSQLFYLSTLQAMSDLIRFLLFPETIKDESIKRFNREDTYIH